MENWKQQLNALGYAAEQQFDNLKARLQARLGSIEAINIVLYRGHGNQNELHLRGRVLANNGLLPASDNDSVWDNILAVYRRFESDELPGVPLQLRVYDAVVKTVSDEEGYFQVTLPTPPIPNGQAVHPVTATLLDPNLPAAQASGEIIIPPANSSFGVISDVDDTILQTFATNLLKVAQQTFLHNARTRLPFPGVAAFYRALRQGGDGQRQNPIFYVSSSPWNLYDLLDDFIELNDIPAGPIFLRDLGLDRDKLLAHDHHTHKLAQIRHILETHPQLPFILMGDSGQQDRAIYSEVVALYPGRIAAIYIRDVTAAVVGGEAAKTEVAGVPLLLAADSYAAAQAAAAAGFIKTTALPQVAAEMV